MTCAFGSLRNEFITPTPRPPQPTRPTVMRLLGAGLPAWPSTDEGMIVGAETTAKTLVFRKQRRLVLFDLVMGNSGSCCLPVCLWPRMQAMAPQEASCRSLNKIGRFVGSRDLNEKRCYLSDKTIGLEESKVIALRVFVPGLASFPSWVTAWAASCFILTITLGFAF